MPLLFDDNKLFSIQLKDARKNMNLTQAKCAEYLISPQRFIKSLKETKVAPVSNFTIKFAGICTYLRIPASSPKTGLHLRTMTCCC